MPVSSHPAAVRAMKSLKTKYRAMKRDYPTLESIVIACPDRDSRDAADRVACRAFAFRLVGRSHHPDNATQWLIDDDPCRGLQAFEASWKLARRSVKCLADLRVLKPTDSPPEPLDPEQLKHHFFAQWTWFVHQLAQTRPGSDLWSCESKSIALRPPYKSQPIDHLPLKDGAVCWTLSVPIFEASALALERVLSDLQSNFGVKTSNPSPPLGESTPQGKGKPHEVNKKADALTRTLDLIPLSTHGPNLINFLAQKTERTAKVKDICKHIYMSTDKPTLAKARRLIDRNVQYLEERDAPLRIVRDKKTSEVRLIDR